MTEVDENCFIKGAIIDEYPDCMNLKPHQFMGSQSPYENEEDSSLDESDDEMNVAVMSDDMFE